MRSVIVASEADAVSMAVAHLLQESYGFRESSERTFTRGDVTLKIIREKHIHAEGLGERLGAELVVVASSHRSEAGVKALLTHPTGNWREEAAYGGRPETLSATSATALYTALHTLRDEADRLRLHEWRVGLEVTHHGPATNVPLIFIEAGGPAGEVPNRRVLEALASACIAAAELRFKPIEPSLGFGGTHYAPTFTRLALKGERSFGHMCPKYALPIGIEMIRQAVEKTLERPRVAVIDWKGVPSAERKKLIRLLERVGLEWVKA